MPSVDSACCHGLDLRADHDVRLNGVVLPLAAPRPVAVVFARVGGTAALHVDDADLPRFALLIVGEQLLQHGLRLGTLGQQIEAARAVLDDRRGLCADRPDPCAHVRNGTADKGHSRRHGCT